MDSGFPGVRAGSEEDMRISMSLQSDHNDSLRKQNKELEKRLEYYKETVLILKSTWKVALVSTRDEATSLPIAKAHCAQAIFDAQKQHQELADRLGIKIS